MADQQRHGKRHGFLLIAAGMMFWLAAILGKQPAFYGVGAVFVVLGGNRLRREGKPQPSTES